jgi:hypothetical protein
MTRQPNLNGTTHDAYDWLFKMDTHLYVLNIKTRLSTSTNPKKWNPLPSSWQTLILRKFRYFV